MNGSIKPLEVLDAEIDLLAMVMARRIAKLRRREARGAGCVTEERVIDWFEMRLQRLAAARDQVAVLMDDADPAIPTTWPENKLRVLDELERVKESLNSNDENPS